MIRQSWCPCQGQERKEREEEGGKTKGSTCT